MTVEIKTAVGVAEMARMVGLAEPGFTSWSALPSHILSTTCPLGVHFMTT